MMCMTCTEQYCCCLVSVLLGLFEWKLKGRAPGSRPCSSFQSCRKMWWQNTSSYERLDFSVFLSTLRSILQLLLQRYNHPSRDADLILSTLYTKGLHRWNTTSAIDAGNIDYYYYYYLHCTQVFSKFRYCRY